MGKVDIKVLFARNLERAMRRRYQIPDNEDVNQSRLAHDSKVSQKSISNYLSANKPENADRLDQIPMPSLPNLAQLADALQIEPWELLHPEAGETRLEFSEINGVEAQLVIIHRKLPNAEMRNRLLRYAHNLESEAEDKSEPKEPKVRTRINKLKHGT